MEPCFNFPRAGRLAVLLATLAAGVAGAGEPSSADPAIEHGRYLAQVAGCNDCHTPGYPEAGGKVDEKHWLTGSPLGWRGPWGTTYPSNLRLVADGMSETQWLRTAREERRPPMPWFNLRAMTDADLTAIYRYLRHLGAAGEPAPAYVPPEQTPKPPYVEFPAAPQ